MSAKATQSDDDEQLTEVEAKAVEIIETASEHDTVLFNDRVQPLTVKAAVGQYEGRRGFDYLKLEGPRGGRYRLAHRDGSGRGGEEVTLRRATGERHDEHGFPLYDDLRLTDVGLVDHHEWRIGQVFEVGNPIRGDEYYHVVTGLPDTGCYDIETVDVRVEDGDVAETSEGGLFNSIAKQKVFDGDLVLVDRLSIGRAGDRGVHYDSERGEEVRLSNPHRRGVDLRPTDGNDLEVVDWETMLFGFEERFGTGGE